MNKYEFMFVVSSDCNEEKRNSVIEKIKSFMESKSVVIEGMDKQGMKKFAYPINYKSEGFYVLVNYTANASFNEKLRKLLAVEENIVRQMIVKK